MRVASLTRPGMSARLGGRETVAEYSACGARGGAGGQQRGECPRAAVRGYISGHVPIFLCETHWHGLHSLPEKGILAGNASGHVPRQSPGSDVFRRREGNPVGGQRLATPGRGTRPSIRRQRWAPAWAAAHRRRGHGRRAPPPQAPPAAPQGQARRPPQRARCLGPPARHRVHPPHPDSQ